MKKIANYLVSGLSVVAIVFSVAAFNQTCAATHSAPQVAKVTSVAAVQPVDLTYAAEKALPSVVHIKYVQNSKIQTVKVQSDPFEDFFNDPFGGFFGRGQGQGGTRERKVQTPKREATGSGVIISADGYIVTNNHVVDGADELTVTLNDNTEHSARIIGADKTTDLALIKIDGKQLVIHAGRRTHPERAPAQDAHARRRARVVREMHPRKIRPLEPPRINRTKNLEEAEFVESIHTDTAPPAKTTKAKRRHPTGSRLQDASFFRAK
ncbi:MAG: trypsin-like peptidase domain-containing protein [Proteobacteria bacterium]|nr:trypsin-like peptidase domain-containing protein [Pseudomonadota bacterium]